jgi:hypothetical protein
MTLPKNHGGSWDWNKIGQIAAAAIALPIVWSIVSRSVDIYRTPEKEQSFEQSCEVHFQKIELRQQVTDDKLNRLLQANGIAEWIATNQVGQIATRHHE